VGGNSEAAIGRAARAGDGWFPFAIDAVSFRAGADSLRSRARGRDVEITAWPGSEPGRDDHDLDNVREYLAGGATRLIVQPTLDPDDPLESLRDALTKYRTTVLDQLVSA
jgi:hypothetical protein